MASPYGIIARAARKERRRRERDNELWKFAFTGCGITVGVMVIGYCAWTLVDVIHALVGIP